MEKKKYSPGECGLIRCFQNKQSGEIDIRNPVLELKGNSNNWETGKGGNKTNEIRCKNPGNKEIVIGIENNEKKTEWVEHTQTSNGSEISCFHEKESCEGPYDIGKDSFSNDISVLDGSSQAPCVAVGLIFFLPLFFCAFGMEINLGISFFI